ncbi:membrane dipeptidase [Altererythrobacter sp. SALINAS58]|uniref:dipeptidase n=1 Tax=Alteripontixanthobacter muriae TaxID=2705546 RepID=UPI0015750C88|nr:dipeptidase [Alteripontixanthobacter muriae]NTZ43270.1 membrane dipeptidase [Alteripontixanthobacter muriae]
MKYAIPLGAALLSLAACSSTQSQVTASAKALHRDMLVLDTHLDTPINFGREGWNFAERHTIENDIAQVDLGRMAEGHLDGGFFVIYTEQGDLTPEGYRDALAFARERSALIDREIAAHPRLIGFARTADEVLRLAAAGKLVALKAIENSYPIGKDLTLLQEFYDAGVRLAGPVHSVTNQFADAAGGEAKWNGLSPLGRQWVAEMNRLGMVIDGSHSSDATFDEMLRLSKTPLLLSHSSPEAAFDHPRNLDNARIRQLAASGGAMCMSTVFLSDMNLSEERGVLFERYENIAGMSPAEQAELVRQWRALNKTEPMWSTTFEQYMTALLNLIEVAGVDHVCFGADWDGGGGIQGLEDITALPVVTQRLLEAGYSPADIEKMASGNVLRIMRAAEAVRGR